MVTTTVSGDELYPSAQRSFDLGPRRIALAWILTGILAAILGRHILSWIDYNL